MPPNLGGFFMVRSYYPSECHADYFDFERIEALKPAIEACGISRSEERRVGKECRCRGAGYHLKKNFKSCQPGKFGGYGTHTVWISEHKQALAFFNLVDARRVWW